MEGDSLGKESERFCHLVSSPGTLLKEMIGQANWLWHESGGSSVGKIDWKMI